MITIEEVNELIRQHLRGKLPPDTTIGNETPLEDLGLSSLQIADIVFTLEERHDMEVDTSKAADLKTVGEMIESANEALAARAAGDGAPAGGSSGIEAEGPDGLA